MGEGERSGRAALGATKPEPQEGIVDKRPEMSTRERIPRALWDAILGVMS